MKLGVAVAAAPMLAGFAAPQGRIETLKPFRSADHPDLRVRVWLPPGYEAGARSYRAPGYEAGARSYRTLYMLDGQYAFAADAEGVNFAADHRVARLAAAGRIQPTLIVAIDNLEDDRFRQYMPQAIYDAAGAGVRAVADRELARLAGRPLISAQFLRFLATRLKPLIDARYRTLSGRIDTAIVGASMAGVIAAAAFVEEQQAFGRAACISPNWPIYNERMTDYPELPSVWAEYFARLGPPDERRLWLDHGTLMMDAGMAPHQTAIAARLGALGWRQGRDLEARVHQGAGHAYAQTAVQMDDVLAWLLA